MTDFVDYRQILLDAQAAVLTANLGFVTVTTNANDRDFVEGNMPLLDLRCRRALPEPLAGRNNYVQAVLEAEIVAFDLTSLDKAATMRDDLLNSLQRFFQVNHQFSAGLDTVTLGPVEFETGENFNDQGYAAAVAVAEINVFIYANS